MALESPVRIHFLVATSAQYATYDFEGRAGFDTDLDCWRVRVGAEVREVAMRDAAQTFSQPQQFGALTTTGKATLQSANISGLTGSRLLSLDALKNVQALDAAGSRALIGAQASLGYTPVNKAGDTMTGPLFIGDGTTGASSALYIAAPAGQTKRVVLRSGSVARWILESDPSVESGSDAGSSFALRAVSDGGSLIDDPILVYRASGGNVTLGGTGATKRDVNLTKDLKLGNVVRISSGGAGTLTTLSTTDLATLQSAKVTSLAGTGTRMGTVAADGTLGAVADAAGSRALIGAVVSAYGGIEFAGGQYTAPVTQAISSGTSWTKITAPFTGNTTASNCTPAYGSANVSSGASAVYRVTCTLSVSASTANTVKIAICKNNAYPTNACMQVNIPAEATTVTISQLVPLLVGEYVDVRVSGAASAFTATFYSALLDIVAVQP